MKSSTLKNANIFGWSAVLGPLVWNATPNRMGVATGAPNRAMLVPLPMLIWGTPVEMLLQ
jgi:hypothetical protein